MRSKTKRRLGVETIESREVMTATLAMSADYGLLPLPLPHPEIAYGGESDSHAIVATEGSSYVVETSLGSLADSTLTVYGPEGELVAFDDDGGDGLASRIEFTAEQSGVYRVVVSAYGCYQTGTYDLTVSSLPIPIPHPAISPIPLPQPAVAPSAPLSRGQRFPGRPGFGTPNERNRIICVDLGQECTTKRISGGGRPFRWNSSPRQQVASIDSPIMVAHLQ